MQLCRGCETAVYPHKAVKILTVVWYTACKACTCKGVWGMPPGKMLEFRFSEIESADYPHLQKNQAQLTKSALR